MASLLLIGGSGFFGKSFLDSFQRNELDDWGVDRVLVVSRHADLLKIAAPDLVDSRVQLINADIGTVNSLPTADFVIHAAASTDARNYVSRPEAERQNIQAGVSNFCQLAPTYLKESKILYVSSGAAYGVQPSTMKFLEEDWIGHSLDTMPDHKRDYAIAKRDAENSFKKLCELNVAASIARCFSFVGPWLPRDQHFAIGNFIEDGLQRQSIRVNATHKVFRSYMHADDLVRWLMTMVEVADMRCETFNVGSDEAVEIGELAQLVASQLGVKTSIPIRNEDKTDRYIPSIKKAKEKLGLNNRLRLAQSICKTIDSLKARRHVLDNYFMGLS